MKTQALPEWALVIQKFRSLKGLTQKEFADAYGVTQAAVSYWESGQNEPPAELLMIAMRAITLR